MEIKYNKNISVAYVITKAYIRVRGYGDGKEIAYTKIPEVAKEFPEPMQSELMEIYYERFPEKTCIICGKVFRSIGHRITCSTECSYKRTLNKTNENAARQIEVECSVCGKTFVKRKSQQKYTCSPECTKAFGQAHKGKVDRTKKKKKESQLIELNNEARRKGLTYGQLQAKRYLEESRFL